MKNKLIEKIKTKNIYVIFLVIYICILLGLATYEKVHSSNNKLGIILNGRKLELKNELLDDYYISKEDLTINLPGNIFYDKVARKLVITTWNDVLKIKTGENTTKLQDGATWYSIKDIVEYFGYKTFRDTRLNVIYVYNLDEIQAEILKKRTEVHEKNSLEVIGVVDTNSKITILLDENIYYNNEKYATVKVTEDNGNTYVGRIEKKALQYEIAQEIEEKEETKIIMTSVSKKISTSTDLMKVNTLAFDMLRIASEKNIVEETYTLSNSLKQDVYAILTNGYKLPGFDTSILSNIVSSNVNKDNISKQILEYIIKNNLKGVVVDFKSFKVSDKELVTQFIKELAAMLHKNDKKIMIKVNSISTYNIDSIKDFIDYVIVQAYGSRTTASKISGSHSSFIYVKTMLETFNKKVNANKLILELAPYSILWTERAGTVINAEEYSMDACTQYIKANNIKTIFDETSGQNIINYTKGIITYKMWLEDMTSISRKVQLAKDMNLVGLAIYRSGYENKKIYSVLKLEEEDK